MQSREPGIAYQFSDSRKELFFCSTFVYFVFYILLVLFKVLLESTFEDSRHIFLYSLESELMYVVIPSATNVTENYV
jgi:hypothetical protein